MVMLSQLRTTLLIFIFPVKFIYNVNLIASHLFKTNKGQFIYIYRLLLSCSFATLIRSMLQQQPLTNQQKQQLQQEKTLHLQCLIQTFSDPSKKLQQHNKNNLEREILNLTVSFTSIVQKLQILKLFCIDYKKTLQTYKKQQSQIQMRNHQMEQQFNDLIIDQHPNPNINLSQFLNLSNTNITHQNQQLLQNSKPLIVLPAKRLHTGKRQVEETINKLKVMVTKVNTKQSTSFQYVYSTYIYRLKIALNNSGLDEKRYRMMKIKKMQAYLPKFYSVIKIDAVNIYPYHPVTYVDLLGYQIVQAPMFFVSFFAQQLLFINSIPIPLKHEQSQLLFCPIILHKSRTQHALKISPWYMQLLSTLNPYWRSTTLLINIYHRQTSLQTPIYFSHILFRQFHLPTQFQTTDQTSNLFMKHSHESQKELLQDLLAIKSYVYQFLLFNHLAHIVEKSTLKLNLSHSVQIMVANDFQFEFKLSTDPSIKQKFIEKQKARKIQGQSRKFHQSVINQQISQSKFPQPIFKAEFIMEVMLFYKRKHLFTKKKLNLLQQLSILLKSILFKLLTQDMQYRAINPAYPGSLSIYYYEKKTIRKNIVDQFLNKFSDQ